MGMPDPLKAGEDGVAVLFSGGMDSVVVVADFLKRGFKVFPIAMDDGSLNYTLRRKVAIEESLKSLGVLNRLVEVRVPEPESLRVSVDKFGFIPGLKLQFLIAAMSVCHVLNIDRLLTGLNADNASGGYLDEGQAFMDEVTDLFYRIYGLETNTDHYFGRRIKIENPFFDKTKAEMVTHGMSLGVDFSTTISCRQVRVGAGLIHCGKCTVCKRRAVSFRDAQVSDPTLWKEPPDLTPDGTNLY